MPVNKNYDSEFCGSIPIHFINSIQAYGVLLVLDKHNLDIIQVSDNVSRFLDIPPEQMLNKPFSTFIGAEQTAELKQRFEKWDIKEKISANLRVVTREHAVDFAAIIHTSDQYFLVELNEVRNPEVPTSFIQIYQKIKYMMVALKEAADLEKISEIIVNELKELSGFDKVMLYQFDEDWNGTVVAEAKEEAMEAYLDLRFPASDIPKQARELYFKNPYRLIPDIHYTPSKLVPVLNPATNSFTDLSPCNLRGVSKVHIEYLKNMHVTSSMSIPVIVHNQLWGLISCHHKTSKNLDFEMLSAFELLSTLISAQITAKERENSLKYRAEVDNLKVKILEQIYFENDLASSFSSNASDILKLFRVKGASLILKGKVISMGEVPAENQIKELVKWLRRYQKEKLYTTHILSEVYEPGEEYKDIASGLLALRLSKADKSYFLGYRPEVIQTVEWGGNPNEAIRLEKDGMTYHPRNSFDVWKQTVSHTSHPWNEEEIEAAEKLRVAMLEKILEL